MKYILNESPIKTTNGFRINDLKLNLDIPLIEKFKEIEIKNIEYTTNISGPITTNIGITYNKSYEINIDIDKVYDDTIYINYEFNNNDILVTNINLNYKENSKANIIFRFKSIDNNKHINHINLHINSHINSKGNISIINLLNDYSYNFIDIDSNIDNQSNIIFNIIDLGSNIKIERLYSNLNTKSSCYLNNVYYGSNNNIIDINYYLKNIGKNSISNISSVGVLDNEANKTFKGTIDFIKGSSKSIGKELENVILLSDKASSKSLPMLLCGEEDVDGSHGVSTGMINKDKLFYLMTKGLTKKESIKLIIEGSFTKILNNIPDKDIINEILNYIDEKV